MEFHGDFFRRIPNELINALRNDVLPHIEAAAEYAQQVYELDVEYYSNIVIGVALWGNLFERLRKDLDRKKWKVIYDNNDLRLAHREFAPGIVFRVHRYDPNTKIPTAGNAAKNEACHKQEHKQLFLCLDLEIQDKLYAQGAIYLGYGFDYINGLSSVSLELLMGERRRDLKALSLAYLRKDTVDAVLPGNRPAPEAHAAPVVDRSPVETAKPRLMKGKKRDADGSEDADRRPAPEVHASPVADLNPAEATKPLLKKRDKNE